MVINKIKMHFIFFLLYISVCNNHKDLDTIIQNIIFERKNIETNIKSFNKTEYDLINISTEGTKLIFYEYKNKINKLQLKYYGETGKLFKTFYFGQFSDLILFTVEEIKYDKPFYIKGYKIDEINNKECYYRQKELVFSKFTKNKLLNTHAMNNYCEINSHKKIEKLLKCINDKVKIEKCDYFN